MNALSKLRDLLVGGDDQGVEGPGAVTLPVPTINGVGEVNPPTDDEAVAREAVDRADDALVDLHARHDIAVGVAADIEVQRANAARDLAVGDGDEDAFARSGADLATEHAKIEALDVMIVEAEGARREAYERLREVQAPRLKREREQRLAEATAKAEAVRDRFVASFAQTAELLGTLADELDSLSALDGNAAFNVGYSLGPVAGNPIAALTWDPRAVRRPSQFVPTAFQVQALVPPTGR